MLNVSRRLADCRVNTDQTHSPSLSFPSLFLTSTLIGKKIQLNTATEHFQIYPYFSTNRINIDCTLSFSEECQFANLAEDSFCLVNVRFWLRHYICFASSSHHILPVYKYFLSQLYFLYFNTAIKVVMDVAWLITAGLLCPGEWVNIWFYNPAAHKRHFTHLPLTCPLLPFKAPNQSYIKSANKSWIALLCFFFLVSLTLTSTPMIHAILCIAILIYKNWKKKTVNYRVNFNIWGARTHPAVTSLFLI